MYKSAFKLFKFSEVNGINLGFSGSEYGAGFGEKLRKQVVSDAFDIVKKGVQYQEIFQLVSLFEENIGPDRLSDMVATIIYPDIVKFTKRIQDELGISKEKYSEYIFREDGLAINPYKGCEILFLLKDILHELPIAKCWDDIDRVVSENENIRREINEAVGEEWSRWYARDGAAQYQVEGSHDAIIEPAEQQFVQMEIQRRKNTGRSHNCCSPFSAKLKCGDCGEYFASKIWHSNSKYKRTIWQCNAKFKGESRCTTPHLCTSSG